MNRRNFLTDLAVGLSAAIFVPKLVVPKWRPTIKPPVLHFWPRDGVYYSCENGVETRTKVMTFKGIVFIDVTETSSPEDKPYIVRLKKESFWMPA